MTSKIDFIENLKSLQFKVGRDQKLTKSKKKKKKSISKGLYLLISENYQGMKFCPQVLTCSFKIGD